MTVTYRLGVIGFLDLPDAPPNRGLLDVVAALKWVQANIESFGGDPDNVTLFGQSAGATIVGGILAAPEGKPLFNRVIMQSGNGAGAFDPEQAGRVTHRAARLLDTEASVGGLSAFTDTELVEVGSQLTGINLRTTHRFDPLLGLSAFSLVLEHQPADMVASGVGATVPLLIGTNAQEGNLYLVPQGALDTTSEQDVHDLAARIHSDPDAAVMDYRVRFPSAQWGEIRSELLSEALFVAGSQRLVEAHSSRAAAPLHRYLFSWKSNAVGGRLGAAHGVELPFVFDCAHHPALRGPDRLVGTDDPPPHLATRMHKAWVDYAVDGTPGWAPSTSNEFTG